MTQVEERSRRRPVPAGPDDLLTRVWQALSSIQAGDRALVPDLSSALARQPRAPPCTTRWAWPSRWRAKAEA